MIRTLLPWSPALFWMTVLYFLSAQSTLPDPARFGVTDTVGHFVLYAAFGVTLAFGHRYSTARVPHRALIVIGVLIAVTDEWHQSFVPGREPSASDLVADGLGLLAGYALAYALFRLLRTRRRSASRGPSRRTDGHWACHE